MTQDERAARSKRLDAFIKSLEIKYVTFAKRVDMRSTYLSHLITGFRPVTEKVAQQIIEKYPRLNIQWLLWGHGDMIADQHLPEEVPGVRETATAYRPAKERDALDALTSLLKEYERRIKSLEDWRDQQEAGKP